jgi:hypothetical protein
MHLAFEESHGLTVKTYYRLFPFGVEARLAKANNTPSRTG